MKDTVILIGDGQLYMYDAKSIKDCQYRFERRIDKGNFIAEEVYWIDSNDCKQPIDIWLKEYYKRIQKSEYEQRIMQEKKEFERLKKKFEK